MRTLLPRVATAFVVTLLLIYAFDWVWLHMRISRHQTAAFDTVQVEVIDQIPEKGNKAEYVPEGAQPETCVRSIFPHNGDSPCWYLRRHATRQINF